MGEDLHEAIPSLSVRCKTRVSVRVRVHRFADYSLGDACIQCTLYDTCMQPNNTPYAFMCWTCKTRTCMTMWGLGRCAQGGATTGAADTIQVAALCVSA